MDKKITTKNNEITILDTFKYFLFLLITVFGVSVVYDIVLSIIASSKGLTLGVFSQHETVKLMSFVISPVVFIFYTIIYLYISKIKFKSIASDNQKISLLPISCAIVMAIIAIFLFTPLMELIEYGFGKLGYNPDPSIPLEEKMKESGKYFFLGVFIYALLPAIAEEVVFRGVIQRGIQSRYNGVVAVTVSTILFVFMHGALQQTVYQVVMGIMLGYVACVGGSILYSIILHFLNNMLVLLFGCFDIVSYLSESPSYVNIFSIVFPVCLFLLGVVLVAILFWVLKYLRTKNFFFDEPKKKKSKKVKTEEPKLGLKQFWKNLSYNEKLFAMTGMFIILFIWIINTASGFMS